MREGRSGGPGAKVVAFQVEDVLQVVQSFCGAAVDGWEFFDVHEKSLRDWGKMLRLDWRSGNDGLSHSISVFQDTGERVLTLCVWFDQLEIRRPDGTP